MDIRILRFDTLDSTNSEAARQAKLGADEGVCVIAAQQIAGRGRRGRSWASDKGSGLYFSIVLRPAIELRLLPLITLMSGVAVHDTLRTFGIDADIKWVNDLLVNEKKIAGILAETVDTPVGLAVVVGIGINLGTSGLPPDIAMTATAIEAETGKNLSADELAEVLTRQLSDYYEILGKNGGPAAIIDEWRQRSTYFAGKGVRVTLHDEAFEGITDGLEENGALRVKTADGSVRIVQAGDVERLRSR